MNKYEKRSKNSCNKKAENYDITFDGKFTVKFKEMMLKGVNIKDNDVLVDIACGNGRLLNMFAKNNTFCGYGVDISNKMIEQAKKLNPDMNFFVAPCERLPLKDSEVDIMTVCAAYHHFPDPKKFAREAARVIKTGGYIYIAEVYFPTILRVIINPFIKFSKSGDVKLYSPQEIISLFENSGFIKESVEISGKVQLIKLKRRQVINLF